jgi:hypothetical protein
MSYCYVFRFYNGWKAEDEHSKDASCGVPIVLQEKKNCFDVLLGRKLILVYDMNESNEDIRR